MSPDLSAVDPPFRRSSAHHDAKSGPTSLEGLFGGPFRRDPHSKGDAGRREIGYRAPATLNNGWKSSGVSGRCPFDARIFGSEVR